MQQLNIQRTPVAQPTSVTAHANQRRSSMSRVMVATGAATVFGSLLPWLTGAGESASGWSVELGKVTVVTGILLAVYGLQGLRKDDPSVRHHGWAIAMVTISLFVTMSAFSLADDINQLSFGVASPGFGLYMAMFASLAAIYPLVQLRKDAKVREGRR